MAFKLVVAGCCVAILFLIHGISANYHERRLYNDIIMSKTGYKYARPVHNYSQPVIVYMNLTLTQILDVDERNQLVTLNLWVTQEWTDVNLVWNPNDYGNIREIKVPAEEIWTPDIVLYNNAGGDWDLATTSHTKIRVFHNSRVLWKSPVIYQLACDINVEFFPFDTQSCKLKMGTWTHDGHKIDLRHMAQKSSDVEKARITYDNCVSTVDYAIDISEYQDNGEWDLLEISAKRNIKKYSCCEENYLDITFLLEIRRKTLFYGLSLINPCIGISFLTATVFYFPADATKKIVLIISVVIAVSFYVLLVFELVPATSLVIPLVTKYLLFTLVDVTLAVIASIVVLNVRFRPPCANVVSPWIRRVFIDWLPRIIFFQRPPLLHVPAYHMFLQSAHLEDLDLDLAEQNLKEALDSSNGRVVDDEIIDEMRLKVAYEGVRSMAKYYKKTNDFRNIVEDWKYVALVLDRFFLILFGIAGLAGISIILQAPTLYDYKEALSSINAAHLQNKANFTRLC